MKLRLFTSFILAFSFIIFTWAIITTPGSQVMTVIADGDSYTVCPIGPPTCDFDTIQAAVDVADDGDLIKVAAGIYTDVHRYDAPDNYIGSDKVAQVVYISKSITLKGGYTDAFAEPPNSEDNPTTLNAGGQGRIFFIAGNISPTIEGFRITGGDAAGFGGDRFGQGAGGGVYVFTATAKLSYNHVFSNTAPGCGGGLYLHYSNATLANNTITNNTTAFCDGGGFYLNRSAATLISNTIANNYAKMRDAGGLFLFSSDATLANNIITGNNARSDGGGLYLASGDDITLSDNNISDNVASEFGGGLYMGGSSATLLGNTISRNIAGNSGGGLHLGRNDVVLDGNSIIGNTADKSGGGLLLFDNYRVLLSNNVVADNRADESGSGLYVVGSPLQLLHTTIARNVGGDGSGLYITAWCDNYTPPFSCFGSVVSMKNTVLVSHTVGISVTSVSIVGPTIDSIARLDATLWGTNVWANELDWKGDGIIITGSHNIWANPDFVDPVNGDYHLGPGSAAIDAGINAGVITDIDGDLRIYGTGPDLGADEFVPPPISTTLTFDSGTASLPASLVYTDTQSLPTRLDFPAGAVSHPTDVWLRPTFATSPAGFAFAGHAFELTAYQGGSAQLDLAFNKPVTVTIHYSEADVRPVSDEEQLRLRWWDGDEWLDAVQTCDLASTYTRDLDNNVLSVAICHLSQFALYGPTNQVYLPIILR